MARRASLGLCTIACVLGAPVAVAHAGGQPVVKSVRPLALRVGERLVLTGSNFSPGVGTRVFFVRIGGGGTVWTAPDRATTRKLLVTVPSGLGTLVGGAPVRFHLRLLTARFGRLTPRALSPLLLPGPARARSLAADWLGAIGAPE